jgi:release factor glutamine methyltransferase
VNLRQALTRARDLLKTNKDIEDPYLESEVLLRTILTIDRASLFVNIDTQLDPRYEPVYMDWIERRFQGEPVAYIIRKREFFKLDFYVDNRVLIPRPETELLVEQAIDFSRKHRVETIADIGTGSGVIAVSLAVNLPGVFIYASDISGSALEVAGINCLKHRVAKRVFLAEGDLLDPLIEPVDILIANLPYVKKSDLALMPSAKFEPALALDGGEEGLDQIFRLGKQLGPKIKPGGCVLLEIGLGQGQAAADFLGGLYPFSEIEILPDLAGIERVVKMILDSD